MQSAIHLTTTVLAGGRIDVVSPELRSGQRVELIVLLQDPVVARPSAVDILAGAPGDRQHRRGGLNHAHLETRHSRHTPFWPAVPAHVL